MPPYAPPRPRPHSQERERLLEQTLRKASEPLKAVVASAPIILFAMDRRGVVTLSEGGGLAGLGLSPGQTVGRSAFEFYTEVPQVASDLRRALAGEAFTTRIEVAGRFFETHYTPQRDARGRKAGAIGVCVDVTERLHTETLQHRQAAAMRASMDGMAILDRSERYIYLNDAHARIYGYRGPEELIGKAWRMLYDAKELKRFEAEIMPAFRARSHWHGEAIGKRRDGSLFPQEVSLTAIEGGGLVCVVRDVTERRNQERDLIEVSARERRRVGQDLHDSLGQHLSGLALLAKVLERKLARQGLAEAAEARRVVGLVQEAIRQARALARGLDPVAVKASGLMAALKDLAASTAVLFPVSCAFLCRRPVRVRDHQAAVHLFRIAQEAVHNAIKHGRAKRIAIGLSGSERRICLSVQDDGRGFPLTRRKGRGMGLHIMRYRARMIGGALKIQQARGGGTRIVCSCPPPGAQA